MHDSSHTHREIVAAVASLKSCLRSVILAVTPAQTAAGQRPPPSSDKIQGSVQRANDVVSKLQGLLSAVADQTLRLPLETSKRLVDVGLPDLLQQLLDACQLSAAWPSAEAASDASNAAPAATGVVGTPEAPTPAGPVLLSATACSPSSTAAAALHPSWASVQQLLQAVFNTLAVLTSVLIRACTRSADPAMVLLQLASSSIMEAQVAYMQQLKQHASQLQGLQDCSSASPEAIRLAQHSVQCAPACVAAFSCIYGLLAAATDAQTGLGELRQQLISSLCSTQLLPVAAELLLLVPTCMPAEEQQCPQVEADCQAAGWSLLTLSLFLSGTSTSIAPTSISQACMQPGQPLPSSMMAASIRADGTDQQQQQPLNLAAAFATAAEPSIDILQEQLLSPPVLSLLQERLQHCVAELHAGYSGSGSTAAAQQHQVQDASSALLLPGRCCPVDQDVLHAALRTLRCWRALLMSPAAPSLPIVSAHGVQLLLALLGRSLAEPIRAGSSEREALRGRVIRVLVHCLQLLCSCLNQELLAQQLPALTAALAGVVSTAGSYWDSNKRAVKSEALPYTGQVRCVDKSTGDMMVRYTMAAQSALELLRQLLFTCRAANPGDFEEAPGGNVATVMLCAGVLPALEQLFRQLPVVSPAHVTATVLLVELLPLCVTADITAGQMPLLVTLRKFIMKSAGLPEPDRAAATSAATQCAELLGALAVAYAGCGGIRTDAAKANADALLQHAAVQLLPALEAYVMCLLKSPIPAPYSTAVSTCSVAVTAAALSSTGAPAPEPGRTHLLPVMLTTYQQLAARACAAPHLQLAQILLSGQVLSCVADILSSNYWLLPGFIITAGGAAGGGRLSPDAGGAGLMVARSSSGGLTSGVLVSGSRSSIFTGEYAVQTAVHMLESLLASGTAEGNGAAAGTPAGTKGMHASCSADCLCALRRSEGSEACQIGNPQCGMDGWCCCASPKACSDIGPPVTPPTCSTAAAVVAFAPHALEAAGQSLWQHTLPSQQHQLLVLAGLLRTRLLAELLRAAQQLPGTTGVSAADGSLISKGSSPRLQDMAPASLVGGFSRPGSATGLTVNVPLRKGSATANKDARGGSPCGVSPKGFSPLGNSAPSGASLSSTLRSQASATQSFLTAYMGEPPAPALGAGSTGLRVTGTGTSRFASSGSAAAGSSPRADDGAFGLLRAGSSGSTINWTAGSSLLQEAGVRIVVRDSSSGFGSSPSLASLASPHAASCFDGSPFVLGQDGPGAAAVADGPLGLSSTAGKPGRFDGVQQRLAALLLGMGQCILGLADSGVLSSESQQEQQQPSSAGVSSVSGWSPAAMSRPVLHSAGSGPVAGFSLLTAGMTRPLMSAGSGPAGMYSSYLQSTSGPRSSFPGSAPYGNVGPEDVLSGIRSCLAAASAAGVVPASAGTGKVHTAGGASPGAASVSSPRMVQQRSVTLADASQGTSLSGVDAGNTLSAEPSNTDVIFPVELGLSQLQISAASDTGATPAAPPCTPATPAVLGPQVVSTAAPGVQQQHQQQQSTTLLAPDLLRRLQAALGAAAPLLGHAAAPYEPEVVCPQVILAKLSPRPLGCWNPSCTNMPGVSEAGVPSKPCNSCKVATFCSKGCEKKAWADHTMACSRLAALSAADAVSAQRA